jgi:hypothetical protein
MAPRLRGSRAEISQNLGFTGTAPVAFIDPDQGIPRGATALLDRPHGGLEQLPRRRDEQTNGFSR